MDAVDEATFRIPETWRDSVVVRRGGRTTREVVPDETAEQFDKELTELQSKLSEEILSHPDSDPELVSAARAYVAGTPTPLGAAVATLVRLTALYQPEWLQVPRLADVWVARHGLVFAAQAVAELGRVFLDGPGSSQALQRPRPEEIDSYWGERQRIAYRMRLLLTAADDADHQAVVDALAHSRDGWWSRVLVAFLVPGQTPWVDELCAEAAGVREFDGVLGTLLCAIGTAEQLDMVAGLNLRAYTWNSNLLTLTDALGPDIVPFADALLDRDWSPDEHAHARELLAALPGDQAFETLLARIGRRGVRPAVLKSMERDPVRAVRVLARTAESDQIAADLLIRHLRTRPDVLAGDLSEAELPRTARATAAALQAADERLCEGLPDLLVRPPWTRPRSAKRAEPVIVGDLPAPPPPRIVWQPDEQGEWARAADEWGQWAYLPDWPAALADFAAGTLWYAGVAQVLVAGPEEQVRPLLAEWRPNDFFRAGIWGRQTVARFGLDALPPALHIARVRPANGFLLLPFVAAEVATLMADWLVRLKAARGFAAAWLSRHADAAVPLLLPAALGTPGPARRDAEAALRFLSADGLDVSAVVAKYGATARAAIDAMLAAEPTETPLAKVPVTGGWLAGRPLPELLLRDRANRLPEWIVDHVVTMLAASRPGDRYPGLDVVAEVCDPGSAARFAWQLFEMWNAAGTPPKDGWVLTALAWSGDDDTVRRLAPLIRAWPGQGGHARAVAGLDVLAELGTDTALTQLHNISQKVPFKGLRSRAQDKIAELARSRGLSPEELADRLVPDFGLDAHTALVLDYGPRRFTVGFDDQLRPFVVDGNGKRRKDLPKPGADDDPELAPAAHRRFAGLKKDVRTVAGDQMLRLERAMVAQRRWSVAEFEELFVRHPLLSHLVRRLVWVIDEDGGARDGDGDGDGTGTGAGHGSGSGDGPRTGFRVAEDGTFADIEDNTLTLPTGASVGIAHPLHLGEHLPAWADVFVDYEIAQPFLQLGRPVYAADPAALDRFDGMTVPTGRILGLERRGWERARPADAGLQFTVSKALPGGRRAVIGLEPGIASSGAVDIFPEQKLSGIAVWSARSDPAQSTIASLDAVTASELLADLMRLQ
ncbi:DUF4132 domain-containing protein [Catenulispora rubra]|uniref:DUF4132 domain-containing protein n=1 Tax=Catenulispora rubra TaxID=280293 RepID=UPI00189261FA|nr:DUF4132 domain-containing protein [Catenulispora rubra]